VGGKAAFCRSNLVDPPCHALPQFYKRVWGHRGGEHVVRGCGGVSGPVLEGHVSSADPKGLVGLARELRRGDVHSRWGGSVYDVWQACEALLQG